MKSTDLKHKILNLKLYFDMKTKFRLLKKATYFLYTLLCGIFTIFISSNSSKKLVRPHGDKCGCKKTKYYSPALGCPNPTNILQIK